MNDRADKTKRACSECGWLTWIPKTDLVMPEHAVRRIRIATSGTRMGLPQSYVSLKAEDRVCGGTGVEPSPFPHPEAKRMIARRAMAA